MVRHQHQRQTVAVSGHNVIDAHRRELQDEVDNNAGFVLLLDNGLIVDTDGTLEARTGFSTLVTPGTTNDDANFPGVNAAAPVIVSVDNANPVAVPVDGVGIGRRSGSQHSRMDPTKLRHKTPTASLPNW